MALWVIGDISFDIIDETTDDPVVTLLVSTPMGNLTFMANVVSKGRFLELHGIHIQASHKNVIGHANLKLIANALMQRMNFDGLLVKGAVRTTGANPGRRPRDIRFTR